MRTVEVRSPTGTYNGPDAVAGYLRAFGGELDKAAVEPESLQGAGDVSRSRRQARPTSRRSGARDRRDWAVFGRVISTSASTSLLDRTPTGAS
jgi:hypothetical protein